MNVEIAGVCTLESSPSNADHSDLSDLCEYHGIEWKYTPDINSVDIVDWIRSRRPDVIFCFGWSRLLRESLLGVPQLGVIGFHPAALPANRGRHPIIWALVLGLTETASTFFFMDEGADSGDILSQESIPISEADDAGSLYQRITATALSQIRRFVPELASNSFSRVPQDLRLASTWRKRGRSDGGIDWRMSARSIGNLVRGLAKPYVGAHFTHNGAEFKVWAAEVLAAVPANAEPGKILAATSRGVIVRCGEGGILLLNTEPPFMAQPGEYI